MGKKSKSEEYITFLEENTCRQNGYLGIIMWVGAAVGPFVALGSITGIFTHVMLKPTIIFTCVMALVALIYTLAVKIKPASMVASYIGLFTMNVLIFIMAQMHIGIYLTFFFVPLASLLFFDIFLYVSMSVLSYAMMIAATYSISAYQSALLVNETAKEWFIGKAVGYTIEFVMMFATGLFINKTIEHFLNKQFNSQLTINSEKRNIEQMRDLAHTDALTGLGNRLAFDEDLMTIEKKPISEDFAFLQFDVNSLKNINDTYGHTAGDEMIRTAAEMITGTIGDMGRCYRTGGDEFVAMIEANRKAVNAIEARLNARTERFVSSFGQKLSVSCGYATKQEFPEKSISDLMAEADERMYEAKKRYYEREGVDRRRS